jgi:hypothetical protein
MSVSQSWAQVGTGHELGTDWAHTRHALGTGTCGTGHERDCVRTSWARVGTARADWARTGHGRTGHRLDTGGLGTVGLCPMSQVSTSG